MQASEVGRRLAVPLGGMRRLDTSSAHLLAASVMVLAIPLTLAAMGRPFLCPCGTVRLWFGEVRSPQTSQHLADWYTLSHTLTGYLLYAIYWAALHTKNAATPFRTFVLIAIAVSGIWEIFENSAFATHRFREATIAAEYRGDSIVNAMADVLAMLFGLLLARILPVSLIVLSSLALELVPAYVVRDNMTLNALMLIYPIDAVKDWQTGA